MKESLFNKRTNSNRSACLLWSVGVWTFRNVRCITLGRRRWRMHRLLNAALTSHRLLIILVWDRLLFFWVPSQRLLWERNRPSEASRLLHAMRAQLTSSSHLLGGKWIYSLPIETLLFRWLWTNDTVVLLNHRMRTVLEQQFMLSTRLDLLLLRSLRMLLTRLAVGTAAPVK